jgi:hypothetical protein
MGKMSREKGAAWEREVAKILAPVLPGARRGIGQARSSSEVADVDVSYLWPECKHGAQVIYRAALRQAIEAERQYRKRNERAPSRVPVVVARDTCQRDPVVYLRLKDFLPMLRAWVDAGAQAAEPDPPAPPII